MFCSLQASQISSPGDQPQIIIYLPRIDMAKKKEDIQKTLVSYGTCQRNVRNTVKTSCIWMTTHFLILLSTPVLSTQLERDSLVDGACTDRRTRLVSELGDNIGLLGAHHVSDALVGGAVGTGCSLNASVVPDATGHVLLVIFLGHAIEVGYVVRYRPLVVPYRVFELHGVGNVLGLGHLEGDAALVADTDSLSIGGVGWDELAGGAWAAALVANGRNVDVVHARVDDDGGVGLGDEGGVA